MTGRAEMLAPQTSADDWDALDRIARQLMNEKPANGVGAVLRQTSETTPMERAVQRNEPEAPPLFALIDLFPLAVALCRGNAMIHANEAFAYAFGYPSFRQIEAAGGIGALFTDVLDLSALRATPRRTVLPARTRSGRRIDVSVVVRKAPGEDDVDLVMLSDVPHAPAVEDAPCGAEEPTPVPESPQPTIVETITALPSRDLGRNRLDFLAKVSHEIRIPLNSIIGFAELMLGERFGRVSNERYRAYLENIQDSGQFALRLVNDLLDISRIQSGAFHIDFTSVDPRETIEDAVRTVQPFARKARVVLRVSIADQLPRVLADLFRLKQVMLNLLTNAIKFTSEHGQVVASASRLADGGVRLRVHDTGVGMSAPDIQIAMQPFRQLDTAPRIETGTGLGLPLTKTLVEAMRARFVIESDVGEGTNIDVIFAPDRIVK